MRPPGWSRRRISPQVDLALLVLGPRDWMKTKKGIREYLRENFYESLHKLVESYARLQLLSLAEQVREQVDETFDYVGVHVAQDRSESTLSEWPEVRRKLLEAITANGDAVAISATEKAQ